MSRLALTIAAICLLAVGAIVLFSQHPKQPTYVIGGQGAEGTFWLVLVDCSEQPTSWRSAQAVCDVEHVRALAVDNETYAAYGQGDAYP